MADKNTGNAPREDNDTHIPVIGECVNHAVEFLYLRGIHVTARRIVEGDGCDAVLDVVLNEGHLVSIVSRARR